MTYLLKQLSVLVVVAVSLPGKPGEESLSLEQKIGVLVLAEKLKARIGGMITKVIGPSDPCTEDFVSRLGEELDLWSGEYYETTLLDPSLAAIDFAAIREHLVGELDLGLVSDEGEAVPYEAVLFYVMSGSGELISALAHDAIGRKEAPIDIQPGEAVVIDCKNAMIGYITSRIDKS